jgi:hypothetical protein
MVPFSAHPRAGGDPGFFLKASALQIKNSWVPAFAGMSGI